VTADRLRPHHNANVSVIGRLLTAFLNCDIIHIDTLAPKVSQKSRICKIQKSSVQCSVQCRRPVTLRPPKAFSCAPYLALLQSYKRSILLVVCGPLYVLCPSPAIALVAFGSPGGSNCFICCMLATPLIQRLILIFPSQHSDRLIMDISSAASDAAAAARSRATLRLITGLMLQMFSSDVDVAFNHTGDNLDLYNCL